MSRSRNMSTRRHNWAGALWLLAGSVAASAHAVEPVFVILPDSPDVIGEISLTTTMPDDTILDIARAYGQGYREIRLANPKVDAWLPGDGTEVIVPGLYVLPDAPREGIVINVAELRLYYFRGRGSKEPKRLMTFPISIGREEWVTPKGVTRVVGKVKDPSWTPPESIRREHAAYGDILPAVVPPGPDNPLGTHALRLGLTGYLIHGTDKPYGIGMRVTHGCIRMYPKDIVTMYEATPVGTPVHIVNQPFKVGLAHGNIYLEVHPHLEEDVAAAADQYTRVVDKILSRTAGLEVELSWPEIKQAVEMPTGIPRIVGNFRERVVSTAPGVRGRSPLAQN